MLKAWHTHGNTPSGEMDFYPLLGEVGMALRRGEAMKVANETDTAPFGEKRRSVLAVSPPRLMQSLRCE
jgi:hypothetical protein